MKLITVILCISLILIRTRAQQQAEHRTTDVGSQPSSTWQYPQGHLPPPPAGHEYHVGQRQGTSLGGPIFSFFPIILIVGIGIVILFSLMFAFMGPLGGIGHLGGLGGIGGYPGPTGPFGKKRSVDGQPIQFEKKLMDIYSVFTDAMDKYDAQFKKSKP